MAYKLDKNTKTIVRAIVKDQEKRDRRKHTGQYTAFDRRSKREYRTARIHRKHTRSGYREDLSEFEG